MSIQYQRRIILLFNVLFFFYGANLTATNVNTDKHLNIITGFDVYGNAIKAVLNNYLENVPVDSLIKTSIDGLLQQLDPYSEYYVESVSNELNIITHGKYFGFGFGFKMINDKVVLVNVRGNSPADVAGLKVGDIIYSINSNVIDSMSEAERLFAESKDKLTTLQIARLGRADTFEIMLRKDTINIQAITYDNILDSNIGYIKLENFTSKAYSEFEHSFFNMQRQTSLTGLIIDLRGNGGGIMQEALKILNMFVPKDAILLTTKGRNNENVFRAQFRPIDTLLPLVVLIDESSASASEIVAGCLQDLDRATIVGNNSFGKGLVQEIFSLSNDKFLKLTTAKYYTPSGRCIQKIDYALNQQQDSINATSVVNQDTAHKFHTIGGRDVLEQNGIRPDVIMPQDTMHNQYAKSLVNSYIVFDFVNYWTNVNATDKFQNKWSNFTVSDNLYDSLVNYAVDIQNAVRLKTFTLLDSMVKHEYSEQSKQILNNTMYNLLVDYKNNLLQTDCKTELMLYLENAIKYRMLNDVDFIEDALTNDRTTKAAIKILLTNNVGK